MAVPRFFIDSCLAPDTMVQLPDALVHHAIHVLRLGNGDLITLFNGLGGEYSARLNLAALKSRQLRVQAQIEGFTARDIELALPITLVQGLASADKMDWIIEKCVELGIHAIVPIENERSKLKLNAERSQKRQLHWQRITQAACEQCGRNRVPEVAAPLSWAAWLEQENADHGLLKDPYTLGLFLDPTDSHSTVLSASHHLGELISPQKISCYKRIFFCIGSESGWSSAEKQLAQSAGLQSVSLGARVLRTETAGMAVLAAIQALAGWF